MKTQDLFDNNGATFSDDRKYRYVLWRIWDDSKPKIMFIGLNPSTANENSDDPTIKRVIAISKNLGYGGVYMLNIFPLVTPYPIELELFFSTSFHETEEDINRDYLNEYAEKAEKIVHAWGAFKQAKRSSTFFGMPPEKFYALKINKNGSPKHPLYCRKDTQLVKFSL